MTEKSLIAGNWKMNGLESGAAMLAEVGRSLGHGDLEAADLLICPPATMLNSFVDVARHARIALGGQDCHAERTGAHTGDISAEMLADAGATFCIVGHSERRAHHGENDEMVRAKAMAAQRAGIMPIVCVGETKEDREAGRAETVVAAQVSRSVPQGRYVLAYEPVWAIGTGLVPTEADIATMHAMMRDAAAPGTRLLYGGSVKPGNADAILRLPDVGGALIGGASLAAQDFLGIVRAAPRA